MNAKITIDSDYEICFDYMITFEQVLMDCAYQQTAYELIDGASKMKYSVVYQNEKLKFKFPKEILLKDVLSLPASIESKLKYHKEMMNVLLNQNFKNPACIELLQFAPTHLIFGLNFKGFGGLCLFCISKFVGNSLFQVSDRCFKLYLLQSEKYFNYLKTPSINMNILVQIHAHGLDKLVTQMYHTFIPTQIFQNITQDDSQAIHHFIPTQEFGIFNFSNHRSIQYQELMNTHQIVVQITTKFDGNKFSFQLRQGNSYNMIMSVKSEIDFRMYYDLFTTKMVKSLEFEKFEEIQQFFQKFILFTTVYLYAQDFKEYFLEVLSKLMSERQTFDFIRQLQMKIAKNMSMFQQKDLKIQKELYKSQFRDLNIKICQQYLQNDSRQSFQ